MQEQQTKQYVNAEKGVYPFSCNGVEYRTHRLSVEPYRPVPTETVLVKCDEGTNPDGRGFYEFYAGSVRELDGEFEAVNTINHRLGTFAEQVDAREAIVKSLTDVFPTWFGYRHQKPLEAGRYLN